MEQKSVCPKCKTLISKDEQNCPNCGFQILQPKKFPSREKTVSTKSLWIAATFIMIGIIAAAALIACVVVSGIESAKNEPSHQALKPELQIAYTENALREDKADEVLKGTQKYELKAMPATAIDNDYFTVQEDIAVWCKQERVAVICTVENVSDAICDGAGVELMFLDAGKNQVGSGSAWVYHDILPGEVVEFNFEIDNIENADSYCLTQIGGGLDTKTSDAAETSDEDEGSSMTPEKIAKAMGDDPESWVAQQAGKKFTVTGPLVRVTLSDDGQILIAHIGQGKGACRVVMLDPAMFKRLQNLLPYTEITASGICMTFSNEPDQFVLVNGALEE